jgi:nucleotide-binding universal stress UspA family protein
MSQQPETAPAGFELGTDGPTAILVGFDGSDPSWRALHYAVGLARRQASRVIAVYAHHFPAIAYGGPALGVCPVVPHVGDALSAWLRSGVEALGREHQVDVSFLSVDGDPVTALTTAAADCHADLIVVGGSAKAGHRLFGSAAVRTVRARCCPVAVVP